VRNEAVLDLVREDIALLQSLLKEFTDRHDANKATDSDVDQILASLEAARAECLAHHATLQNSWRSFEQIVGAVRSRHAGRNPCRCQPRGAWIPTAKAKAWCVAFLESSIARGSRLCSVASSAAVSTARRQRQDLERWRACPLAAR